VIEYSRQNPSPRYRALLAQYQQMHAEGLPDAGRPPEKTFPGFSLGRLEEFPIFPRSVRIRVI